MNLIKIDEKLSINEKQRDEIVAITQPSTRTLIYLKGGEMLLTDTPMHEVIDLIKYDHLKGAI